MSAPRLVVCTPFHGGGNSSYITSMMRLQNALRDLDLPFEWLFLDGDSLVQRARNNLVCRFLETDGTHLLFIDNDEEFFAEDVLAMLDLDLDVVGGVYCAKTIDWTRVAHAAAAGVSDPAALRAAGSFYCLRELPGAFVERRRQGRILEVECLGTGLLMIRRGVFERMVERYGDEMRYSRDGAPPTFPKPRYAFFHPQIIGDAYQPEDFAFCMKWRAMGGRVHAFLDARIVHIGSYGFVGDPTPYFREAPLEADVRPPVKRDGACICGSGRPFAACHGQGAPS